MQFLRKCLKHYTTIMMACLFAVVTAGCGGGGVTGANQVGGNANKGPFQQGATVTAYQVDSAGNRSATNTKSTTVTDNLGTYSFTAINWSGPTVIEITGSYLDENTGNVVTGPETLSAVVNLPAIGAAVNSKTVNPNVVSDIVAKLAKANAAAAAAAGTPVSADAVISAANATVLQALGLPTTDSTGAPIDAAALNLTKASDTALDANVRQANAQLLAISAASTLTAGTGADAVTALADNIVTDIQNGNLVGTAAGAGVTTALQNNIAKVQTNAATIAANLTAAVQAVDPTAPAVAIADVTTAVTTTQTKASVGALKGFALSGNTFTVGTAAGGGTPTTYTIANTGAATVTSAGSIKSTDVVVTATFKDYSGVTTAQTLSTTFDFFIASTTDSREIYGSISPVTVTTDGAGKVSITVPANAVLTFSGVDSLGATVSGTATNLAADVIQATASNLSINANSLLTTIQNKVGNATLNVLNTAGTFTFEFGLGLNIGYENATANGIDKLYQTGATGAKVVGRRVYGTITTF